MSWSWFEPIIDRPSDAKVPDALSNFDRFEPETWLPIAVQQVQDIEKSLKLILEKERLYKCIRERIGTASISTMLEYKLSMKVAQLLLDTFVGERAMEQKVDLFRAVLQSPCLEKQKIKDYFEQKLKITLGTCVFYDLIVGGDIEFLHQELSRHFPVQEVKGSKSSTTETELQGPQINFFVLPQQVAITMLLGVCHSRKRVFRAVYPLIEDYISVKKSRNASNKMDILMLEIEHYAFHPAHSLLFEEPDETLRLFEKMGWKFEDVKIEEKPINWDAIDCARVVASKKTKYMARLVTCLTSIMNDLEKEITSLDIKDIPFRTKMQIYRLDLCTKTTPKIDLPYTPKFKEVVQSLPVHKLNQKCEELVRSSNLLYIQGFLCRMPPPPIPSP